MPQVARPPNVVCVVRTPVSMMYAVTLDAVVSVLVAVAQRQVPLVNPVQTPRRRVLLDVEHVHLGVLLRRTRPAGPRRAVPACLAVIFTEKPLSACCQTWRTWPP